MFAALRHRETRWVGALYAYGALLEWGLGIALMVLVYGESGSALAAAGMLLCTQLAPNVVVAGASALLDRVAVRPVYVGALALQAAAAGSIGLFGFGPHLYLLGFVGGIGTATARSAVRAAIGRFRSDHDGAVRQANAVVGLVRGPAGLLGPVVAGAAVATLGADRALMVLALFWLFGAVVSIRMPAWAPVAAGCDSADGATEISGAPSGLSVTRLLVLVAIVTCIFSVDEPVLLGYMRDEFSAGAAGYSAYFVAWGVGMTAGGLLFTRLIGRPMLAVFALGTGINALAHLGLFFAPSLNIALALAVVGGIGNGIDWVALSTAIQEAAPRGQEGRIGARLETLATIGAGSGILLGGALAEVWGARFVLVIPAIGAALLLLVACLRRLSSAPRLQAPQLPLRPAIQGGSS